MCNLNISKKFVAVQGSNRQFVSCFNCAKNEQIWSKMIKWMCPSDDDRDGYNDGGEDNDDEDNADNMRYTVFEV